jgi:hypothetical protein
VLKKWFRVRYLGGHSEYREETDGWVTTTDRFFVFKSAKWRLYIPCEKIREINIKTTKEITALRVLLLKPVLASLFKKRREFLLVAYEDKLGLRQNLLLDTRHKREIILNVRSSLPKMRQKKVILLRLMKCPQCGRMYSSRKGYEYCPTCKVKLEPA